MASASERAVSGYVNPASGSGGGYVIHGNNSNPDGYAGFFVGRLYARDHTVIGRSNIKVTSSELFGVHTTARGSEYGGMYVSG